MSELLGKYKRMMALSIAEMRKSSKAFFGKGRAKSKLAEAFGLVGYSNPRFYRTLPAVTAPKVRSAARKAHKLIMRRAKRVRIDTRGYA